MTFTIRLKSIPSTSRSERTKRRMKILNVAIVRTSPPSDWISAVNTMPPASMAAITPEATITAASTGLNGMSVSLPDLPARNAIYPGYRIRTQGEASGVRTPKSRESQRSKVASISALFSDQCIEHFCGLDTRGEEQVVSVRADKDDRNHSSIGCKRAKPLKYIQGHLFR